MVNDNEHLEHTKSCDCSSHDEHVDDCTCGCHKGHQEFGHKHLEQIKVLAHEEAFVGSFEKITEIDYKECTEMMKNHLHDICRWVQLEGGYVGHIKAVIQSGELVTTMSTTGKEVQVKTANGNTSLTCRIGIAVIVFSISLESIKEKLQQIYDLL
ncbi:MULTISPECIES: hypothetical protein [unclassified Dehalobacter]|jgi:hypothetical protein|uniref:hypothetical protein n=1 Tax=unclassified Dehalobacter TaxID=2635733 RepID=UPI00028B9A69|nr:MULTISPECIES: hypothetical protein [unclassified Dehalobacter]AFV03040.1 hypothetical protein DHBDCA_p2013 [Dehalobacter sp. DCA]AFV06028.1 hypothetical protein DCF50_p2025 [Dehalobacter sp. CF]